MYKYLSLFFFYLLMVGTSNAQKLEVNVKYVTSNGSADNSIIYYGTRTLVWDDFIAPPKPEDEAAAMTSAGFGLNLGFKRTGDNATLNISVYCNFNKKQSWVKNGRKTDYILNHEQKHFDISFISTILFIQKLKKADFTTSNYSSLLKEIYSQSANYMNELQNKYDSETSNGRIPEKQEEWNKKISDHLSSLNAVENIL